MSPFEIDATPALESKMDQFLHHVAECPICYSRMVENQAAIMRHMLEQAEKEKAKEIMP